MTNQAQHSILDVLARRVRVVTIDQVARFDLCQGANPKRCIDTFRRKGVLESVTAPIIVFDPPEEPLVRWIPGDPEPDHNELARVLRRRWTRPAKMTTIVHATRLGGSLHGRKPGRPPRASEVSHDVALAEVFLRHFQADSATGWRREDELPEHPFRFASVRPDACVRRQGRAVAIELGGRYRAEKLERFYEFCCVQELPYELW